MSKKYVNKKADVLTEATRRYKKTRLSKGLAKASEEISQNPQFKKELHQLRENYPYPPDFTKGGSIENMENLNAYMKAWGDFCNKWGIDSAYIRMFNKVVKKRPFTIELTLKEFPIKERDFINKKLNYKEIMPKLIETGYVGQDLKFTMKSLRLGKDFRTFFPDYSESKFKEVQNILRCSVKSIPSIKANGPITEQEYHDMGPLMALYSHQAFGAPLPRSGRKSVFERNRIIYSEYKRRRKSEKPDAIISELAKRYDLKYETIQHVVHSKKFHG